CRLHGKVAIITGAASGIGECTARLFVLYGAKLVIADIQDDLGQSVCEDVDPTGQTISYIHSDVTQEADLENLIDTTIEKHGKLDIMYNNAGIAGAFGKSIVDTSFEEFKKVIDVNVLGSFLGAKHAARVMIPAKKGCILFTSSVACVIAGETPNAYTTSKHAIVGLTKNLCVELGQYGIRVNCISPFALATPLLTNAVNMEASTLEAAVYESAVLKGTFIKTEDVAEAAVYLSSDESKYINGLNLVVDGGYATTNPTFSTSLKASLK
ncbi:secoisolariciresinol dehydrogenase-like, partial [Papaver somniferum]|uniref:secoisolariciresinol dehydrogenase-like n=1 Tax=Papaver somniferum TaxID=3469 RepID=UPI000E6FF3B8